MRDLRVAAVVKVTAKVNITLGVGVDVRVTVKDPEIMIQGLIPKFVMSCLNFLFAKCLSNLDSK